MRYLGFSLKENICTARVDFCLTEMKSDYWLRKLIIMCVYLNQEWEEKGAEKH